MALVGWPNEREERLDYCVAVPGLLSVLVSGDPATPVPGLDQTPPRDRPPVLVPFATYHVMVYTWGAMMGLVALATAQWYRGRLFARRWVLWAFVVAVALPYVANQAGWVACEVGRQPWVVQGILRTSEAHSSTLPRSQVLGVIVLYALVYVLLFVVWVRLLNRLIQHGPEAPIGAETSSASGSVLDTAAQRPAGAGADHGVLGSINDVPVRGS
jgi:cytochrome d ubiquinol oxidase subunit I